MTVIFFLPKHQIFHIISLSEKLPLTTIAYRTQAFLPTFFFFRKTYSLASSYLFIIIPHCSSLHIFLFPKNHISTSGRGKRAQFN